MIKINLNENKDEVVFAEYYGNYEGRVNCGKVNCLDSDLWCKDCILSNHNGVTSKAYNFTIGELKEQGRVIKTLEA